MVDVGEEGGGDGYASLQGGGEEVDAGEGGADAGEDDTADDVVGGSHSFYFGFALVVSFSKV
ncbi:MAG: hypothetical protein H6573_19180 [Lewinellaceae bacterium]|nr:hypothetical protein [Lewinellaceae bacterium]